jgi:nucleoside-diphosphate-sugar epimerase
MSTVLVTGGSGFIASYALLQLLAAGHAVRTTVRNAARADHVKALMKNGGAASTEGLSVVAAHLEDDAGWAEAVRGCDYVLHIASPFPAAAPRHEDELIVPARDGALRVLRFARDAGVKRVVMTSSFAAIGYGHAVLDKPFDETTWTDLAGPGLSAYVKSKTIAERAAWNFITKEGGGLELSVVNPVGVLGPALGEDLATSVLLVQRLLNGSVPGCPRLYFGVVDVRDVADLHLRCMTHPAAKGERFIATASDSLSVRELALALKERLGPAARRVPTRELPDWLVRIAALFDPAVRNTIGELGKRKRMTGAKARQLLGWSPRTSEEAIAATGESLVRLGLVKSAGSN